MVRQSGRWLVGVAACAFGVVFTAGAILAEPRLAEATSTVEEIMKKGHGKKGLLNQVKAGAAAEKWEDLVKPAAELRKYGEDLGKNKPEKGEDASWMKLTAGYKTMMLAIADGVEKKDKAATSEALTKMNKSCKACHDQHK